MAHYRRRSLGAALVVCAPPLARIHERLFDALGLQETGVCGAPGGRGNVFLSQQQPSSDGVNENEQVSYRPDHNGPVTAFGGRTACSLERDSEPLVPSDDHGRTRRLAETLQFGLEYFSTEWLSKLDTGARDGSRSRAEATWEKFTLAERSCFEVNQYLKRSWRNSPYGREIHLARKIASKILGPFDWNDAARCFGWGPGATTRLTRRLSDAAHKYSGTPHATIGNAILANAVLDWNPLWKRELPLLTEDEGVGHVKIVPGNRVVTVPKNYKTDRTIAIEPDMNIYVQKGVGGLMRGRLKEIGCNLDDQSRNQRMARIGSVSDSLATIDLSMASDTISRAVVETLIRPDWLEALGQCRSPFGVLPSGEKIFYQKFSSMGNGFTFELETLIFLSLAYAWAVTHGEEVSRICVYGDDIVVPSTMASSFCGLLSFLGFKTNEKKSYWEGPFRESCGKHYFHGYDVTPFYVKKVPKTLIDLFKLHNQIWRYCYRCQDWLGPERSRKLMDTCKWLRSYAPARWRRPSIVDGVGDGGFLGLFDEVLPRRAPHGWDGYVIDCVLSLPVQDDSCESPGLLMKSMANLERKLYLRSSEAPWARLSLILEDSDDVEVLPVKGQRYVKGEVFISTSFLHRQCSGLLHP